MDRISVPELSLAATVALGLGGAGIGVVLARVLSALALRRPAGHLVVENYRGKRVAAVLGPALVLASVGGMVALSAVAGSHWTGVRARGVPGAALLVLLVLGVAGLWDDLRGDERPRGFSGHLGALRTGSVTGGVVKLAAGAAAGLAAGWMLTGSLANVVAVGLLVALTANLVNLFDRRPGRAAKLSLLLWVPLLVWGPREWTVAAAAALGALLAVLPLDLGERAMLGDAGANPLGGLLGLGLALALPEWGRWIAIALLGALNAASERWSFGSVIDASRWLRWLDRLGRVGTGR
jgi:UDP-N-acetylmuramyl pentapeptide phosphotransferase/UDP-N-acetylglucosamine-1-phosphate transferase